MDEIKRSSSTEPMDLFQPNLKTQSTKYLWVKGIPRSFLNGYNNEIPNIH